MESYVLKRNENLCYKLGMNFDEANELFGSETLSGMQMVQVNGGGIVDWIGNAWKTIKELANIGIHILDSLGGSTPNSSELCETNSNPTGQYLDFKNPKGYTVKIDSLFTTLPDGTTTRIYGLQFSISSSPSPAGPTQPH